MEYRRRTTTKWINGMACLAVVAVLVWLVVWLVDRRKHWHIRVSVEGAALTRFELDRNGSLHYNLSLSLRMKNDNRAAIRYDRLEARAFFAGEELGVADVIPPFSQSQKSATNVQTAFHGEVRITDDGVAAKFDRGEKVGYFDIDVNLFTGVSMERSGDGGGGGAAAAAGTDTKKEQRPVEVGCMLKVPVASGEASSSSSRFRRTVCDVNL